MVAYFCETNLPIKYYVYSTQGISVVEIYYSVEYTLYRYSLVDTKEKADAPQLVRVHSSTKKTNDFLLLLGPQLQLRTFQGITMTSKCQPVDPISMSDVSSTKILSVEIRMMTIIIPPSAFVDLSTRTTPKIVVLIFGGKLHFTVK